MKDLYTLVRRVVAFMVYWLVFTPVFAQQDIKIEDERQFVISYYNKSDRTKADISVEYKKKDKEYEITADVGGKEESFTLKGPLNIVYFSLRLNETINKVASNSHTISQGSVQEIFIWIYSITDVLSKEPVSGKLLLNTHVLIISDKNKSESNINDFDYRANKLSKAMGELEAQLTLKRKYREDLRKVPAGKVTELVPELDFRTDEDKADEVLKSFMGSTPKEPSADKQKTWTDLVKYYNTIIDTETKSASLEDLGIFPIKSVSIQLERGFLERIQVWIPNENGRVIIYENIFAIGFSSIKNFRFFESIRLVPRNGNGSEIYLSDVFANYDNLLDNYTRDYSPADTTINGVEPGTGSLLELKREKYVNLFDSKIYTDLNGLNQSSPNGLVQIELSRRFNLKTSRQQVGKFRSDVGFLSYINAFGSYNKIEQDQKFLRLRNANIGQNGVLISPSYATNLDFRRYENFSLGSELNTFLFDWPDGKLTFFLDLGARYGHTPLVDYKRTVNGEVVQVTTDSTIRDGHTFAWYPKISLEIFAERRVGLVLGYQFNKTYLLSNNDFKQIKSYAKSDLLNLPTEYSARISHMIEFYLRAETTQDKNGRIFMRARFFLQHKDINTFFPQFQLGYAYNLVFKK